MQLSVLVSFRPSVQYCTVEIKSMLGSKVTHKQIVRFDYMEWEINIGQIAGEI